MIVVIVPAPAINGKAIGTNVPEFDFGSSLNKVIPNIISMPSKNRMIDPATANDSTSTPNRLKMASPEYKNIDIISKATILAFADSIFTPLFLRSIIMGILPMISITENKIKVVEIISL